MVRPVAVLPPLVLACLACASPPPPQPVVAPPALPVVRQACPGGLLCEAPAPLEGWRVPELCAVSRLGQRVVTCWLQGQDWPRLVEFLTSRYPHAVQNGPLLRIVGQAPPARENPAQVATTTPLLLAHQRPQGVELVLLAGDPVDMPGPATDNTAAPVELFW